MDQDEVFEEEPKKRHVSFELNGRHNEDDDYADRGSVYRHKKLKNSSGYDDAMDEAFAEHMSTDLMDVDIDQAGGVTNDHEAAEMEDEELEEVSEENQDYELEENENFVKDAEWADFVEEKRARGEVKNCEGLDIFLKGRNVWDQANDALSKEVEKFEEGVLQIGDRLCHDLIGSVQRQRQCELNELAKKCQEKLTENQQRRYEMMQKLQEANSTWKATYKSLVAGTVDMEVAEQDLGEASEEFIDGSATEASDAAAALFEKAQLKLQAAEECFKEQLDEASETWKDIIHTAIQDIVEVHGEKACSINGMDTDIRAQMISNHERGVDYAKKLQEANDARQEFFAALLQKVTTKGKSLGETST